MQLCNICNTKLFRESFSCKACNKEICYKCLWKQYGVLKICKTCATDDVIGHINNAYDRIDQIWINTEALIQWEVRT